MKNDVVNLGEFFRTVFDVRPMHVYRINSQSENPTVIGQIIHSVEELIESVKKYNTKKYNIYYAFNQPRKGRTKKPRKNDISWIYGFHVDVDIPSDFDGDRKEWIDEKIVDIVDVTGDTPQIIFTGNGLQALWEFEEPIRATEESIDATERVNRKIAYAVGGDHCHNVDRMLRVPGTINWPSPKKKALGYVKRDAEIMGRAHCYYLFEDFDHLAMPVVTRTYAGKRIDYRTHSYSKDYKPVTYDELANLNPELDAFETTGDKSADAMKFICHCIRGFMAHYECDPEDLPFDVKINIAQIVWDRDEEFMSHYEANGPEKLGYDIDRSMEFSKDEFVFTPKMQRQVKNKKTLAKSEFSEKLTDTERMTAVLEKFRGYCRTEDLPNLDYSTNGIPKPQVPVTLPNVSEALKHMRVTPRWDDMRDVVSFDFHDESVNLHMKALTRSKIPRQISNTQLAYILAFLTELGMRNETGLRHYIDHIARENRFHPFTEYCTSKAWDGISRIKKVADCITSRHPLKELYITTFFLSMAAIPVSHAHYLEHGIGKQISNTLILIGEQGIGKSRFFEAILPGEFLSRGSSLRIGSTRETDAITECLGGALCVLNELGTTLTYSNTEALKDFLAKTTDEYRRPYAREAVVKPRCTVFVGTANSLQFKDQTGNRRFQPMEVDGIDLVSLSKIDMQQVYAEAYHMVVTERSQWWLTNEEEAERDKFNEYYRERYEEEVLCDDYLNSVNSDFRKMWLSGAQVCKLLGLKYAPSRVTFLRQSMLNHNIEFADSKIVNGKRKRKIWKFPVPPELVPEYR